MKKNTLIVIALCFIKFTLAQTTLIPDANFEQTLIDLGYDSTLDGEVLTANINTITSLDVQNKNISSLDGIEDFTALQTLFIDNNNLISIDLSQNTALGQLSCSNNNLSGLDLSSNLSVWYLDARFNQLTDIDVKQCTLLQVLSLEDNQLTFLNLNPNVQLTILSVKDNNLGALSVKNGNNTDIVSFDATNNPGLLCIQVEDVSYSTTNWTNIDAQTSFSLDCLSQLNTYVPDDNFEQELINLGVDTVLDDYVLTSNISSLNALNLQNAAIDDLTGIEDFEALVFLYVNGNNLTELDVSNNTNLTLLVCSLNNLTNLDVSNNTLLETLNCSTNSLSTLDVSQNTQLKDLQCSTNQLTSLNAKNGNNTAITTFAATNNLNLNCIEVDDAAYSTTNWTSIDFQTSFSEDCHYNETYVPDDNFEQALIDLGYDTVLDNYVPTTNISTITVLDVNYKSISDLTGIEDFTALQTLNCKINNLTSLNVTNNINLVELNCSSNYLTSLNVTQNSALTILECGYNNLSSLDVTQNLALEILDCSQNDLTSLNVSQNLALKTIKVFSNNLTALNLTQNTLLEDLTAHNNNLTSLNVTQNTSLIILSLASTQLTSINLANNTNLETLKLNNNTISSIDVSQNVNLKTLNLSENSLSTIDLSNNTSIMYLYLNNNNLLNLDVSTIASLKNIVCGNNQIAYLNLSNNSNLEEVSCYDSSQLIGLDVSNGNNTSITYLNAINCPNLTCIQVDDVVYSTSNWTSIDVQTNFSLNCHFYDTYVPDNNFEQALIDSGLDSGTLDGYVPTANIENETMLSISLKNISDLTGIEDFTALQTFLASSNAISTADFSQNLNLTYINLVDNDLTDIDVSQNTLLTHLFLSNNFLTNIDVSNNTALEILYVSDNLFGSLNVSANTLLEQLNVYNNNISSLNTNTLNALEIINCSSNKMEQLNFSNNPNLTDVTCNNNSRLVGINLSNGNNMAITYFNALNSPNLYCVKVDNEAYSTLNWTNIDATASFSEDCSTLSVDESYLSKKISLFPNPATNNVILKADASIKNIKVNIYNALGKLVLQPTDVSKFNISSLKSGIYFVKIEVGNNNVVKKLLVE